VLLVEDNDAYRDSLGFLLGRRPGIDVVGGVATGTEAAPASEELAADVAVVDLRLPDVSGVEAAEQIRARSPRTAVVFSSASVRSAETTPPPGSKLVRKDEGIDALVAAIVQAADT
jgi:two-component system, NarL family, response regulator DevR